MKLKEYNTFIDRNPDSTDRHFLELVIIDREWNQSLESINKGAWQWRLASFHAASCYLFGGIGLVQFLQRRTERRMGPVRYVAVVLDLRQDLQGQTPQVAGAAQDRVAERRHRRASRRRTRRRVAVPRPPWLHPQHTVAISLKKTR